MTQVDTAKELGAGDWGLAAGQNSPESWPPNSTPQPGSGADSPMLPPPASREAVGCELAAEVLNSFGRLRLRVVGISMLPTLWPGDIVSVHGHPAEEVKPGDIVVFRHGKRLVTHRVIQRTSCQKSIQWITRGDRMNYNDAPVSSQQLLGRVVSIERGSRRLVPRCSIATRLASWILRQSEFATIVVLRLRDWGLAIRDTGLGIRDTGLGIGD